MKKLLLALALMVATPALAEDCVVSERLHPISRSALELYKKGNMKTEDFLRYFNAPNSSYIPFAECLVSKLDKGWETYKDMPFSKRLDKS